MSHDSHFLRREETLLESQQVGRDALGEALLSGATEVYAVLDACGEPRVPGKVQQLGCRGASLYQGLAQQNRWDIAPYLVQVDQELLDWTLSELGDHPWGILIEASCDLSTLRRHLRRFVAVRSEQDGHLLFRFYDPRILPAWLQSCEQPQLDSFFGPARAFLTTADQESFIRWTAGSQGRFVTGRRSVSERFIVSTAQMNCIALSAREDFRRRLEQHMQAIRPNVAWETIRQDIATGLTKSRQYGIVRECDVAIYVELICRELGSSDARHPREVDDILYDRRCEPAERLQRLEQYFSERSWKEAGA